MKKMIKYTLLKAMQITAVIFFPIVFLGNAGSGEYLWASFDLWIFYVYLLELIHGDLEMELHGQLYKN